ncbi:strawberry notch -like protein, partial [Brachionus plicatilis]
MDDILNAAIQDAGLETNLCSLLDNQCDTPFSTSSPSSSSCYTSFSKDLNNNDQDFNLNDLDFSFLTDASNDFLVSSSLDISSNSVSPIHNQDNQNCDLMLSDDPFLAVLNHFDQNNLNIESNEKTSSELRPNNGTHLEPKIPNRKIIKINSLKHSNQSLLPYSRVVKSGTPAPNQTNSTVRIVSISNRKKVDSPRSDLNSLINFRNPLKTFNVSTNAPKAPLNANPVKVINLSHLQQKNLQERLISTSACKRIIKIQNNQTENRSAPTTGQTQHFSNQNIKITKVVSSKPVSFQNQSTTNMVFLNKTKNKLFHFNSNLNEIQKKPLVHEIKNKTVITKTFNSNNLTIPKVIMTPKTITSPKNQETLNIASKYGSYSSSSSVSSHLNALNSHLSRFANSNQALKETLVDIQIPESNATPINQQSIINGVKNNNQTDQPNEAKFVRNESIYERDDQVVVEEEEELGHAETYADYMPSKLKLGLKHPDPIVETSSLASVEPPDIWYELRMASSVYEKGALSALQLEAVVYACQKHSEFLPNSHRCGFLIGDGAGVGKGRTIAGIIYENYLQGRKKALWLSVSNDLKYDAQRDFSDIGASDIQIFALNKLKYSKISSEENSNIKKGVIFSTYSSLIGESQQKTENKKYSSRLEQLFQWLGGEAFDGVIVFDECHKAKNLVPIGSAKPTKTGLAVLELQEKLPKARIVYASATGASEPKNMAYMVRLGLWGTGTPFNDFNDFIQSVEKRGVGAMEIIAIDMKLRGMYIARQLSFTGVTFKIQEIPLRDEYIRMYDDSVKLWVEMKEKFQEALDLIDLDGKMKKTVWGQFWSSHQRFFKYLCLACKVPSVVELAKKALNSHKCVVIGLQSTGEARTLEHIDEGGEMNDFVSTARGVLHNLVEKHFPSKQKKQVAKSPKISQNVNQIFKRLSSYTNPQKISKKKHSLSESSISSFDDSSFYDSDSFESLSSDLESAENNTTSQYDSGLSSTYSKKSNSFDSDDSDSLFSITKSVPQQNVTSKKTKKPRNKLNKSPNKRKKPNTNIYGYDEFNDRMEDEDNDIQIIEPAVYNESAKAELDSESDEEFSLPVKRVKSNEEQDIFDIDDPFGFCISKPEQSNRPKPTEPNQIEQYIHEIKSDLLNAIKSFGKRLPANTLDELIDLLNGPDHVAEMTGRKGRIVSQKDSNNQKECYVYETRNENDVPVELMNFVQKERFMNGEKLVAIISEAASSGISLQANRRYANQLKRVHITIELPWSADRAIQQFGRTHRSNQVSSPEYVFLISQLAGEKRFASTVAKRLESLGALTHGDRRATESRDLSQFNIDNKYGRTALENVIRSICQMEKPLARFPISYKGDFIN